jgi:hypothetical protein
MGELRALRELSAALGADPFGTQGTGGNTIFAPELGIYGHRIGGAIAAVSAAELRCFVTAPGESGAGVAIDAGRSQPTKALRPGASPPIAMELCARFEARRLATAVVMATRARVAFGSERRGR